LRYSAYWYLINTSLDASEGILAMPFTAALIVVHSAAMNQIFIWRWGLFRLFQVLRAWCLFLGLPDWSRDYGCIYLSIYLTSYFLETYKSVKILKFWKWREHWCPYALNPYSIAESVFGTWAPVIPTIFFLLMSSKNGDYRGGAG
jgi:hypothetical protein